MLSREPPSRVHIGVAATVCTIHKHPASNLRTPRPPPPILTIPRECSPVGNEQLVVCRPKRPFLVRLVALNRFNFMVREPLSVDKGDRCRHRSNVGSGLAGKHELPVSPASVRDPYLSVGLRSISVPNGVLLPQQKHLYTFSNGEPLDSESFARNQAIEFLKRLLWQMGHRRGNAVERQTSRHSNFST